MGMRCGLVRVEHGREAGVGSFQQRRPFITGALPEQRLETPPEIGPARRIVTIGDCLLYTSDAADE